MKNSAFFQSFLVTSFVIWGFSALAQPKYEREYFLKQDAIPSQAMTFIREVFKNERIQWYGEENLKGTSIEAKLKSGGQHYSIEFSDSGMIQDVEILTRFGSLPSETRSAINERLKKDFRSYKISKTQTQWTGTKQALKEALITASAKDGNNPEGISIKYELIVRAKKAGASGYYEVLTDKAGQIQTIRQIIQRNTDNLIY